MIIDLTHTLQNGMPVYPGTPHPSFKRYRTIEKDGYAETRLDISTHMGTHIDAPAHIIPGAKQLDEFPLEQFTGQAFVLDCRGSESITPELILAQTKSLEEIGFLLFYTGWEKKWGKPEYFEQAPTLTVESAQLLVDMGVKGVGFDHISADRSEDSDMPIHHTLLSNNVLIIENLANLRRLANQHIEFFCMPLRISDSDGSPIRAFARLYDE